MIKNHPLVKGLRKGVNSTLIFTSPLFAIDKMNDDIRICVGGE